MSDRVWTIVEWPFIALGISFAIGAVTGLLWSAYRFSRWSWARQRRYQTTGDMTIGEAIRVVVWALALMGATAYVNVVAMHHVENRPAGPDTWLVRWLVGSCVALGVFSLVAGLVVLRATAPWGFALTLPFAAGPVVGITSYVTWTSMGQDQANSAACNQSQPCDIAFGFGAVALSIAPAVRLGVPWLVGYGSKRLAAFRLGGQLPTG
jgi:hypothetical protein